MPGGQRSPSHVHACRGSSVRLQADGLRKFCLPPVKGPKLLSFQFQGGSHVQGVESPNPQPCPVSLSELRTNLERSIGQGRLRPQTQGAMLLESLQQTVSLAARNRLAEYVLFDRVRPLGYVQGRHP